MTRIKIKKPFRIKHTDFYQFRPLYTLLPLCHKAEANGCTNNAVGSRNGKLQK